MPNAKLIIQQREWDAAADPELVRRNVFSSFGKNPRDRTVVHLSFGMVGSGTRYCAYLLLRTPAAAGD